MLQKSLNLLLSAIILLGGVVSYCLYEKKINIDQIENFRTNVVSNFKQDSIYITKNWTPNQTKTLEYIDRCGFNIEIFKRDSIIYWNHETEFKPAASFFLKRFKLGQLGFQFSLDKDPAKISRSSPIDTTLFWAWVIGSILLLAGANRIAIKQSKQLIFGVGLLAILMSYFISIFAFESSLRYDSPAYALLSPAGLCSYFLFLLLLLYLAYFASKYIKQITKVRYITGSFIISLLVFGMTAFTESFISDTYLEIKSQEIFNLGYAEFNFFILSSLYLLCIIFIAKSYFFSEEKALTGAYKTVLLALPVVLCAFGFIALGFKTNTIGIVLFLLIIFLLLDLYFEYFEINLSFILASILIVSLYGATLVYTINAKNDQKLFSTATASFAKGLHKEDAVILSAINDSILSSQLIPSIASLPYPQNVDVKDILTYLNPQLKLLVNYKISNIFIFDKGGASLALNQISNKEYLSQLIARSDEIARHIFFSSIDQNAILYYSIENNNDHDNPINLYILFENKEKRAISLPYGLDLGIYKNKALSKVIKSEDTNFNLTLDQLDHSRFEVYHNIEKLAFARTKGKSFFSKYLPAVTLFMTSCGFILLMFIILNSFFNILDKKYHLNINNRKSLRSRFQTTIVSLILFSFVLIGATTVYFYNKLYQIKNTEIFRELSNIIIKEVQTDLSGVNEGSVAYKTEMLFSKLDQNLPLPLAYFNEGGKLIIHSDRFTDVPARLQKTTLKRLFGLNTSLKTISIKYKEDQLLIPIYNKSNSIAGYFLTKNATKIYSGLYDFISTLLTICVFLFLTALALSILLTTPITRGLKNLSDRLKNFKLGRSNQALEWNTPDEIGALILNYNKMQEELEVSADLLSKTQRDLAWREMAKQVAHEIKNPLTPMKLSLQHMQNTAQQVDGDRLKSLIAKTSSTVLEQINNLTQIADEFSSFGTLPKANNETIVLNEVVEHIHDLFRKREDMDILMEEPMYDLYVFADKNQLIRILNNIVKNATQSIPEEKRGRILISLESDESNAIIRVRDNGSGIQDHMKDKVFTPNFTTKSSGTGLGLAISANMVESMDGKLYFVSPNPLQGTDFYIELPIIRTVSSDDHSNNDISLD